MGLNRKCPRCGGKHVQLTGKEYKLGCLWLILFKIYYVVWVFIKWIIGIAVLIFIDWWMAIIKGLLNKGYVWKSKKFFSGTRKYYYCHDCGNNFEA